MQGGRFKNSRRKPRMRRRFPRRMLVCTLFGRWLDRDWREAVAASAGKAATHKEASGTMNPDRWDLRQSIDGWMVCDDKVSAPRNLTRHRE